MGKLKEYFIEQGITVSDIPKAIIIHEVISVALAAFWWAACYQVQPIRAIARRVPRGRGAYEKALVIAKGKVDKMQWLKRLPGSDSPRLTTSFAESLILRGFLKPISFPGKLWASYKLTIMCKPRQKCIESTR
ncbi:hypothetical protein CYMTET_56072 [Cymbomonas tetramitiformis]|uniref:Uncharacterized protein n=1 Tax=Cymbomonas tetramitiformis TaxID=36881 RepID=A0AAE0EMB9_9CHLO|nr:hypothetical protein CYMTET_56072 [Cymbomonas tetramitiformis]